MTPQRTTLDRLLAAYPLLLAYLALVILFAWETTRIPSPWIFTDELQWAMQSRAIAHTGRPELRLHPVSPSSVYPYFIAPAWWLGATSKGYAAAKYLNAFAMTATIFPAYGLARFLVSRPAAFVAAIASAAIPSLALTGVLMPESLAYFWSTLALYLVVRALVRPTRWPIVLAVAAVIAAPAIRGQLEVVVVAALIAAIVMAVTGERGRGVTRRWTHGERVGAFLLVLGFVIAVDVVVGHHSYQWYIGTHFWHRAWTYALWALGALTIGVGVLPVLFSLAWLLSWRSETPAERAMLGALLGATVGFGVYTGVKASFLSTTFSIRVEERNVIYLSPLVFAVAAHWLTRARARLVPLLLSGAAVGWLLWSTPYHAYEHQYSDALGLSILQWLNQEWYWTNTDLERLLFAILAAGVLYGVARARVPVRVGARATLGVAAVLGVLVVGWNLAGEIQAANASRSPARFLRSLIPTPADWIDRDTGRARTMYFGQSLQDSFTFWTLEFWNQSIQDVWTTDASGPPPGPEVTPNFLDTNGTLDPQLPLDWIVAQPTILVRGRIADHGGGLNLYRVPHPIRLASYSTGVQPDGWLESAGSFVQFAPHATPGTLTVSLSRTAANGVPPSRFTFRVSSIRINSDGQPVASKRQRVVHAVTTNGGIKLVHIEARAPFRVDVKATTFKSGDGRDLSAVVNYTFSASR